MIDGNQKLYFLKILTWFSSFVIVLFHYGLWFELNFYEKNSLINYLLKKKEYGANFVYLYWAITGFFFINLYHKDEKIKFKSFFIKFFAKYYPLHFVTLILVFIIQYLNIKFFGKTEFGYLNDIYHFALNIFFASNWGIEKAQSFNAPIWFMSILVPVLIFFFLTFTFLKRIKIFFSIFVMVFFYYIVPFVVNTNQTGLNFSACFFYFYLGVSIFYLCDFNKKYKKKFQIFGFFGVVISVLSLNYNFSLFYSLIKLIPSTVLLFFSLILLCQNYYLNSNKILSKFETLMDTSYSIYLLHFPLQLVFILIFNILNLDKNLFSNFLFFLFFIAILIIISVISVKNFEKPSRNFFLKMI